VRSQLTRLTRLIAIDLDGTLEDSRSDMVAAARRVRAALGLDVRPDALLLPYVNGGMDQLYRACFDDYLADAGQAAYDRVRRAYEADYLAHVAVETRLYPGMREALPALAQLGTLACVTNKPERISRRLLEELGVERWFRTVVGGDTCAHAKPHPVMLQTAAIRCELPIAQTQLFMIGDTNADMELGRVCGANRIWCAWGYVDAVSEAIDARADTPLALPGIVTAL
jgi:HAD superfamily hydrolase (TIGR01549 family)